MISMLPMGPTAAATVSHSAALMLGGVDHTSTRNKSVVAGASSNATDAPEPQIHKTRHLRKGTIASACFNIWSTMVGGGSLSLPLAFAKTGNALLGPLLLIVFAATTEFCFRVLLEAAVRPVPFSHNHSQRNSAAGTGSSIPSSNSYAATRQSQNSGTFRSLHPPDSNSASREQEFSHDSQLRGTLSVESIVASAFGSTAYCLCTLLVYFTCFFGVVGYCVLIRDMLQPVTKLWWPASYASSLHVGQDSISWGDTISLWTVVVAITPLCTWSTLTSLRHVSVASMCSVLLLGSCIVFRSVQCSMGTLKSTTNPSETSSLNSTMSEHDIAPYWSNNGFHFLPPTESWRDVLDVIPLFISCFGCHFNIPVVYNDLQDPTPNRVRLWLRLSVWISAVFYLTMGMAGSVYATACADTLHGNILLDFPTNDPLVLVGRLCLALSLALALPVFTVPARDILLRAMADVMRRTCCACISATVGENKEPGQRPPLVGCVPSDSRCRTSHCGDSHSALSVAVPTNHCTSDHHDIEVGEQNEVYRQNVRSTVEASVATTASLPLHPASTLMMRSLASMMVLWIGTAVASCVSNIDVVWVFLGSSLSIVLSYLIPCGCFVVALRLQTWQVCSLRDKWATAISWVLIIVFVPLMLVSTTNAIYNTAS